MEKKFRVAAQLSSVHSTDEALEPSKVQAAVEKTAREVPLDVLIVGWKERPGLFRALTAGENRLCPEVFLWYPLLSDYPGFDPTHLVMTLDSGRSRGWSGYEGTGIEESFKQACPNNPRSVSTSLAHLDECMSRYPFDGVFLDKIRFPSGANGLQDMFSCFCPFCIQKAAAAGLDLAEVRSVLESRGRVRNAVPTGLRGTGAQRLADGARWLDDLVAGRPVLQRFIDFRVDSIRELVGAVAERMRKLGKKVSLDVFTPVLAPCVGQSLSALARCADWVKPMIYRFGTGPSSLRTEVPSLIRELGTYVGLSAPAALAWAADRCESLRGMTVRQIERSVPLALVGSEAERALALLGTTPLYLGLETVSIPGRMEVSPRDVEETLEVGARVGVQGFVMSWDLLHTPLENVKPLGKLPR